MVSIKAAIALSTTSCSAMFALAIPPACAQPVQRQHYDLPRQSLSAALRIVAERSGRDIGGTAEALAGRMAPAIAGDFTPQEAVERLLQGSGLRQRAAGSSIVVEPVTAGRRSEGDETELVVTGSRIRGAPIASPVVRIDDAEIRDTAHTSLGDVARALPQNFGGGQNPGIGITTPAASGIDVSGGSGFNLRGLGSDATLTLLNGHRLAYSASRQSIDLSTIPTIAVERIEIVADGASALYGSDAVAGVANVILKSRADGIEARANFGVATDGGYFVRQAAALGGTDWRGGTMVVAYEFAANSAIDSEQRSYAAAPAPGLTLFPEQRRHGASLVARQALATDLTLGLDALYNWRRSVSHLALNPAGDLDVSKEVRPNVSESLAVAPRLDLTVGAWNARLAGAWGRDRVDFRSDDYEGGVRTFSAGGYYRNVGTNIELSADGPLVALPGGKARLALGVGYRNNDFTLFSGVGAVSNIAAGQSSTYAYGELSLPIVGSGQLAFLERANLSAALRHERYPGIGSVTTPKLGLVLTPAEGLDLKASWGKSFKAATMFQLYQPRSISLLPIAAAGGAGFPAGTTVLVAGGGNMTLRPERATSWSATVSLHPGWLEGFQLDLGYFNTRYVDRIVTPVTFTSQALRNPAYRDYVAVAPSRAAIDAAVADAVNFFNNSGAPFDPSRVGAIVNRRNVNAGRQAIQGFDLLAQYVTQVGDGARMRFAVNASYLTSDQQILATQPVTPLAGTLYNPAHFRARGSASWSEDGFNLSGHVTRTGGVSDTRSQPAFPVRGMTTLDLSVRQALTGFGPFDGVEIGASVQNLFNAKPAQIATSIYYEAPFDTTNYSPVGRFLSLSLAKKW